MGAVVKQTLTNRVWELVEPSIDGYSNLIEKLMSAMTEDQLQDVLDDMDEEKSWQDAIK
jgi:hypothetical protein